MRVLITGGYGCIGSWVVKTLLDRGHRAWVFDLKQDLTRLRLVLDPDAAARVPFIAGDVTDVDALNAAVVQNGITHLLHLAGLQVPVCRANPILGARVNVLGTLAVFETMRALRSQVERLVYASSAAVFSPPERYSGMRHPLPDDAPLEPVTHYGVFKCTNEANARIYWLDHGIPSVGLRPGTVYGVGRDFGMTSEPTKAVKSVVMKRPWTISYQGEQDFQLADDVAATFVRCLERPHHGARTYNIRGTVESVGHFRNALALTDPETDRLVKIGDGRLSISYDFDDKALQDDFGPLPKTPLDDGVRLTYERFVDLHRKQLLDDRDLVPSGAPVAGDP